MHNDRDINEDVFTDDEEVRAVTSTPQLEEWVALETRGPVQSPDLMSSFVSMQVSGKRKRNLQDDPERNDRDRTLRVKIPRLAVRRLDRSAPRQSSQDLQHSLVTAAPVQQHVATPPDDYNEWVTDLLLASSPAARRLASRLVEAYIVLQIRVVQFEDFFADRE